MAIDYDSLTVEEECFKTLMNTKKDDRENIENWCIIIDE